LVNEIILYYDTLSKKHQDTLLGYTVKESKPCAHTDMHFYRILCPAQKRR